MKEKAEKGGGVGAGPNAPTQPTSRIKEEGGEQGDNGHTSRPPSASLPNSGPLKKDPDSEIPQHRVKMEGPPSAHGPEDSGVGDLGVDGIKTEIDGLMDDGDPTKSPSCDLGPPGSLKSERLSSDSNDILDPQTGLRGPPGMQTQDPPSCRGPQGGPESMGSCRMGPGGPMSHMGPMNSGDSVQQPLPSNVIGKQTGSMEYSQQQSQIFVFSTLLANKGAEAVLQGHFQSIIAYHCAQPGTKKYLEKHPLKMGQFNKQNPAQWLNNFAMVKNRGAIRGSGGPNVQPNPNMGPNMGPNGGQGMPMMGNMVMGPGRMMGKGQMGNVCSGMGPMDGFPGPNSGPCSVMDNMVGDGDMPWDTKSGNILGNGMSNSPHMGPSGPHCSEGGPGPTGPGHGGPGGPHTPSDKGGEPTSPSALLKLPSLQGVKIPDENLTPQQRAHREEQLATIRKMQQMLFPESGSMGAQGPHGHLDPNQQDGPPNSNIMTPTSQSGPQMGPGMGFPQSQMGGMGPGPNMGPNGPNMGPNGPNMGPNGPNMGPNGPNIGPNGQNMGPNGPNMGPNGPMGPSGPNMGPNGPNCAMGPMGGNNMGGMQSHGPMGPNGMMGPMGSSMGPGGPFGPGPCMKGGGRNPSCGGPDMKSSMCGDMHMSRTCGGPMGRIPNPMGGMGSGGPKPGPCMMGPGPRMMPGANINAMNGGIMMDSSGMGGPMGGPHGDCSGPMGPDSHMGMNGPMCDDFARSRNFPSQMGPMDSHKLGLRSPRSPGDFDWQKIHQQFFEQHHPSHPHDGKNDGDGVKSPCSERGAPCPPPPPYGASPLHRSASVPIATQSPSHTPNSNIQMPHSAEPSRAGSTLNSPAPQGAPGPQGQNKGLSKNPGDGPQEEGVFVRQLQCLAQQQQQKSQGIKEANLMPVPSPQQIQYLNAFEGQELTIQKQPNTSIKEGSQNQNAQNNNQNSQNMNSNQKSPAGGMPGTPDPHCSTMMDQRSSRFSMEQSPGFPGSNNPLTPNSGISSAEKQRPSPQSSRSGQDPNSKTPQRDQMGQNHPSQPLNQGPYAPSSQQSHPNTMTSPNHPMSQQNPNFKGPNSGNGGNGGPNSLNGNMGSGKMVMGDSDIGVGPQGPGGPGPPDMNPLTRNSGMGSQGFPGPCSMAPRPDNIPINPNQNPGSSFDPISSLAQMSQQLTNSVGGGPSGPGGMGPGGMGPGNMGPNMGHFGGAHTGHMQHHGHIHPGHGMMMTDMGCHMDSMGPGGGMGGPMDSMMGPGDFPPEMNMSPKMGGGPHMGGPMGPMDPSMMGPRIGPGGKMAQFNGANVQVKASAPNTIQYLPTRSQMQCNANPRGPPSLDFLQRVTNPMHMEAKAGNINMQYFPGSPCGGPNMNTRMEMNEQMNAMSGMRPQGSMMGGGPMRGPGMLRMPHGYPGGFNSPPKMAGDPYSGASMVPNPNMMCNPNFRPQMMKGPMGPGPMGGAPMGMRAPTTTQPLPPSMGGPGNFKNSQNFVVPSTADPNYAQQFHNFQQQLYATGTRSQNAQGPPGPQGPPMGPGAGSPYGGYGVAK